ncbi:MAG: murein biosynthesis integral membrane protein MurJ [Anaerolineaceae bacterium]
MEGADIEVPQNDNQRIARAAGTIMLAMILGQVLSLISSMLITRAFGTSVQNDAYNAANRLPDILYSLVAGGALASAFIPTFTTLLTQGKRSNAWKLASAIANLVTLILVIVCAITAFFAPWVVHNILARGFDANEVAITVGLLRVQLCAPIIFGLSGLMMGILNAHQNFLWPAFAPAMYSAGKIIGVLFFVPVWGVKGLALGVVLGAALHALIQLPVLLRLPERRYTPGLGLKLPHVREVIRLMGPRLIGVSIVQLNFLINTNLASQWTAGITAISVAFATMLIPEAFIAQAAATAALPTFSAQVARGKPDEMRTSLAVLLRAVISLALPASLGLILLRQPLITLLYQRGEFTAISTTQVSWVLLWYASGLVFHSVVEIISRAFYALHDTKTPVFIGVFAMSLNIGFSFLFVWLFNLAGWLPYGGLALANTTATALETVGLLFFMRRRLGGLHLTVIGAGVLKAAIAAVGMSLAVWGWLILTKDNSVWFVALGGIGVGAVVYLSILALVKAPELKLIGNLLKRFLPGVNKTKE